MKKLLGLLTIILSIRSFVSLDSSMKCERIGQQNNDLDTENELDEEITSTSDYLEFNNKKIEKLSSSSVNTEGKVNIDNFGNMYFQEGEKLFMRRPNEMNPIEIRGINLYAYRSNEIFFDRKFNVTFVGTKNGLFAIKCCGPKVIHIKLTQNISVDFGITDSLGNIYFGTDGSNTERSEQLYVFKRSDRSVTKINGIETTLGSYPVESRGNRNKIAVDSKDNVYVGAYTNYVYLIKPGDTEAIKIKDNSDIGGVTAIVIDSQDNVYCRNYVDLYMLKNDTFIKILETVDNFDLFLAVDFYDNLHFRIAGEEYILKPKEISAMRVEGIGNDENIILSKNIMVRNKMLYFTTTGDGREKIYTLQQGETNATAIHNISRYHSMAIDRDSNIFFLADSPKIPNKIVPYVLRNNAKRPIEIRGIINRLSNIYGDNKNNIYLSASNGLHVLNFDEVIPHRLRATGSHISSLVVGKDDYIYFGTDYDGAFVLKAGEAEATKIDGINWYGQNGPLAIETFADKYYDVVYFQTEGGGLYKLVSGDKVVNTIVENATFQFYLSDCRNNTYFVIENNVYLIESGEEMTKRIATVYGQVLSIDIDSSGRLYFGTTIGLQVLNLGASVTSILSDSLFINALAIDQDDNVYFGTDDGAYVLRSGELLPLKIDNIDEGIMKIVINVYDVYFISTMGSKLFVLQNKLDIEKLFPNKDLGEIDNNNDDTILNSCNFLNIQNTYLLNRSKNKVVNKTETSAMILGVRGKYVGEFKVEYTIRNHNTSRYFVNLAFLGKAIFFNYINENLFHYEKTKNIKDIQVEIDNLRFFPVEVTKESNVNSSVEFKSICDQKKVANTTPINQVFKLTECNHKGKETVSFEITTGYDKPGVLERQVSTPNDEKVVTDFLFNEEIDDKAVELSNKFELSSNNLFSKEMPLYDFVEPEQEIVVPPMKQILVKYSVRTFTNKINLRLLQKVNGVIVAKVIDNTDEQVVQITLRNAMQVLEKFSQLPVEVIINDDNSITFDGKATMTLERESQPNVFRNFI